MGNYENLTVWKEAHKLTLEIYKMTNNLPKEELFALTSQIRRAAISVESNLAEGESRYTQADKIRFFVDARASGAEVETQLLIIKDLYKISVSVDLIEQYKTLGRQINSLINHRRKN